MGLTMSQREGVTKAIAARYKRAVRLEKGTILEELCATTGLHRNLARKALGQWLAPKVVRPCRAVGSTEAWAMRNHSPDSHPIHEHLTELRLVGRWPVTAWGYKDALGITQPGQDPVTGNAFPVSVGAFQAPGAFESGPKDTFVAPPDYITVWVGQYNIGGTSVWHCHILSHEDGAMVMMMRPLVVGTAPQTQLPVVLTQKRLDQLIRQP
jgi:Multicopper oxidase